MGCVGNTCPENVLIFVNFLFLEKIFIVPRPVFCTLPGKSKVQFNTHSGNMNVFFLIFPVFIMTCWFLTCNMWLNTCFFARSIQIQVITFQPFPQVKTCGNGCEVLWWVRLCVSVCRSASLVFAYPDIRYPDIRICPLILWQPKNPDILKWKSGFCGCLQKLYKLCFVVLWRYFKL